MRLRGWITSSQATDNSCYSFMASLQIDEFYRDAAKILVSLFDVFPRPVTIYAEDIAGPDEPDEYGVHSKRYQACFAAMLWLGEEGYIRYQDVIRQDAVDQAVLTGRCFSALIAPQTAPDETLPESVRIEQSSAVFQLRQALSSGSSDAVARAFAPLLERMSA